MTTSEKQTSDEHGRVQVIAGGPVLVRGIDGLLDKDGCAHPATRPVVAVCACGLSQRGPWCDGTHKVVPGR